MRLPFTVEQFLDVFERYNTGIWPAQIAAYILGIAAVVLAARRTGASDKLISGVLAVFWIVMGALYHVAYFSEINKAAYVFGALFILQGLLFVWHGVVRSNVRFAPVSGGRFWIGVLLIAYAMVIYPLLGYMFGHQYPRSPMFGVAPCPTTIFTFGLLLWADGKKLPRYLVVIPFLWGLVGFMAAVKLGVREDIGLIVAALVATPFILKTGRPTAAREVI